MKFESTKTIRRMRDFWKKCEEKFENKRKLKTKNKNENIKHQWYCIK